MTLLYITAEKVSQKYELAQFADLRHTSIHVVVGWVMTPIITKNNLY